MPKTRGTPKTIKLDKAQGKQFGPKSGAGTKAGNGNWAPPRGAQSVVTKR